MFSKEFEYRPAYNPRGFLADLKTTAPQASGGAVIAEFGGTVGTSAAMTYDAVGNRTKMTGTLNAVGGFQMLGNGSSSSQYTYDSANELTQEQTTEPGNGSYANAYAYDGAQNRTSLNGTAIGHNVDNQLSASGAYTYDGNGNPTTYTSPGNPVSGSANTLTFDPENRMTSDGLAGSTPLLTATYDSDGLRTKKVANGVTTYYVYDQQDRPVAELNASGSVAFVNAFGDNGLLSRRDVVNSLTTYYAFDPQGSAVDVMQGAATAAYSYTAFGLLARGATPATPWQFGAQWGYYTDGETGLILCTHRYYDPYTGRFIYRDPESYDGGVNLYNHCTNNPINGHDPTGFSEGMPDSDLFMKYVVVPVLERIGLCGGFITVFMIVGEGTAGGPGDELPDPPAPQPRFTCAELESQGFEFNSLQGALNRANKLTGGGNRIKYRKGPDPLFNGEPGEHYNYEVNGLFLTIVCKPCKDNPYKKKCKLT